MGLLKVGCAGFPVSQRRYFAAFPVVEIDSSFYQPPQAATARRWRETAPKDFEFTVKAWQLITHPAGSPGYRRMTAKLRPEKLARCGHFQDTPEVAEGWRRTEETARLLGARIILFQTPTTFFPGAENLRAFYRFFRRLPREEFVYVWEPRGESWQTPVVRKVCAELDLVHGVDPLVSPPARGRLRYFRLRGKHRDRHVDAQHRYSDDELAAVEAQCRDGGAYVIFNNSDRFEDAGRLRARNEPALRLRRTPGETL